MVVYQTVLIAEAPWTLGWVEGGRALLEQIVQTWNGTMLGGCVGYSMVAWIRLHVSSRM